LTPQQVYEDQVRLQKESDQKKESEQKKKSENQREAEKNEREKENQSSALERKSERKQKNFYAKVSEIKRAMFSKQPMIVLLYKEALFVSILVSFCVWTKSLKCKDAVNRDSTIQSLQVRRIQVPYQPFGRSSHPVQTPICPLFHLSGRRVSTSGRLPVLDQFLFSFQVPRKGRSINRPDDVVFRPDARLLKARIAVQI